MHHSLFFDLRRRDFALQEAVGAGQVQAALQGHRVLVIIVGHPLQVGGVEDDGGVGGVAGGEVGGVQHGGGAQIGGGGGGTVEFAGSQGY